ncbi:MAG: serine hydrolase domain-containing protein [Psychroflexus sp.]
MKSIVLVALMAVFGSVTQAQTFDDNTSQTLKNYISEFPNQTQFSVAIVDGNETQFYGQVKFADAINQLDNSASVFQIGSVTKVFTSTLLAQLVIEKEVRLTDSIQKYFSFSLNEKGITLEELSNHTSGLPRLPSNLNLASVNPQNPYKTYAEADLEYYLSTEMEVSSDEKTYQYSNIGASVLAKALENASRKSYEELLSEKIFHPLEMNQSTLRETEIQSGLVQGLDQNGNPTPAWEMGVFEGAGAILSSTKDLSQFVKAHFKEDEDAFSLTLMPTFLVNPNLRLGLGWHILQDDAGNDLYWHNGGTGGYSASIYMVPESQKAVVILTNVSGFHPKASSVDELGFKLLNSIGN